MRIATTATKRPTFPRRLEQPLAEDPPSAPTAVHVYDKHGMTRMVPLDLDAHERTDEEMRAVAHDLQLLTSIFDDAGATYLADEAHGGAHVYLLLDEPMGADDARTLVLALAKRLPTLDPGPVRSASDGLITIPGSAHRHGGHRRLTSPLELVRRVAAGARTSVRVVRSLRLALADEIRQLLSEDRDRDAAQREALRADGAQNVITPSATLSLVQRGIGRHMHPRFAELAQDGDWRAHGYPSPSEARISILMSAIATGLQEIAVRERMLDGTWPGLRSMFDHKGLHRLTSEYQRAVELLRAHEAASTATRENSADSSDTSARKHRRGAPSVADIHGVVRAWRTLVYEHGPHEFRGAPGWKHQQVLRALATASHMNESLDTATGVRWISVATGYSIETVAVTLRDLALQRDPWIELVERAYGPHANRYALRIPRRHMDASERARWVTGRAHALRPVFTVLGVPAALVYEAVEHGRGGSYAQLMLRTGLGRDSVREAVSILASWGLIAGDRANGWRLTSTDADLERLAERLGASAARARRLHRYRKQRAKYWEYLEDLRTRRPGVVKVREVDQEPPPEVLEMLWEMRLSDTG